MKTAAAYIRVSTEDQTEFSPDSQLKAVRKYADEHNMILPDKFVFVDEGISGRKADKRPSFQQMIGTAKLRPKPFDVILLWKFSRFARNREDSIVYKSMLRKQCGIDVISISEQLGEDKTSILMEAVIEAMDEYYSLNLAEEVRRGMAEKFSRGGVVSQPPFGYKMGNGIFIPHELNSNIVKMIFSEYLSGTGTRQIAAKLNDMGIRSTKGNCFENRTVEYILTNPVYIGKLRRSINGKNNRDRFHQDMENTSIVSGGHQPLVSSEIFEAVQLKLAENKKIYKKYQRQLPVEFMLKGLVKCSCCGATLTMMSSHKHLQCSKYAKGSCNVSHYVDLDSLNHAVLMRLKKDFFGSVIKIKTSPVKFTTEEFPDIAAMIDWEKKKLLRACTAYQEGVDTLEEYKKNKSELQSRISELLIMQEHQSSMPCGKIKRNDPICAKLNVSFLERTDISENMKNIFLRSITDCITFFKPEKTLKITYKI